MPEQHAGRPDGSTERVEARMKLSRSLAREGYDDVLVLSRESGERILSPSRLELLDRLRAGDVESVRSLADDLDRDKAGVSRDLALLAEHDVVEYVDAGRAKVPVLKHDTVVVEPLA